MGVDSNLYDVVLVLHLVLAFAGFGGVAFNAVYLARTRQLPPAQRWAAVTVNFQISQLAEYLIYAVAILGFALVSMSQQQWKFTQGWISVSLGLYIVLVGVFHGIVRPNQRDFNRYLEILANAPTLAVGSPVPVEVSLADKAERNVAAGWGAINLLVVAIVVLMVFKPGT
jgi:uncharacterized membrane protein